MRKKFELRRSKKQSKKNNGTTQNGLTRQDTKVLGRLIPSKKLARPKASAIQPWAIAIFGFVTDLAWEICIKTRQSTTNRIPVMF